MSKTDSPKPLLEKKHIAIAVLGTSASLAGSIAGLTGSVALYVVTALAIGLGCLAYFVLSGLRKRPKPVSNKVDTSSIPDDRIDALTGLANENGLMAWFLEKGPRIVADGKGIVLLVADLADFSQIEKSRGKGISDRVLIEIAKRVESCTGAEGMASRHSGGQFAAVATVVASNSAEVAAEQAGKLADLMQRPVELDSGIVWIGGSVGAAYGSPTDAELVLARAREALKKAIRIGRGHYVVDKS